MNSNESNQAKAQTQPQTSAGAKTASTGVTFASKSPNFTIYLESPKPVTGPGGQLKYEGGRIVRFQGHRYSTKDRAEIAALRECDSYRNQFQEVDEASPAAPASAAA